MASLVMGPGEPHKTLCVLDSERVPTSRLIIYSLCGPKSLFYKKLSKDPFEGQ
jgi:hypothetical protein